MEIKARIPSKFYQFWKEKTFVDFVLKTKIEDISCHKIILSKFSKFFTKGFVNQTFKGNEYTVQFDPDGKFTDVIAFFYTNQIDINLQNIAQYAAIGEYYEIDSIFTKIDAAFDALFTIDNACALIKNFCSNKVLRYHEKMIYSLIQDFDDFKMDRIIKVCDSKFLSGLLRELHNYSINEQVSILDKFTKIHGNNLSSVEKKDLTSIYNFSKDNDSYRFLLSHQCDWMVSSIQRELLSIVINKREEQINNFNNEYEQSFTKVLEKNLDTDQDSGSAYFTGKWKVFSSISDISLLKKSTELDLFDFIRTFDGMTNKVNPLALGLINVDHSEPISPLFGGLNIFSNNSSYYFASSVGSSEPYISFDLGHDNCFAIHSLQLESPPNDLFKPKRPLIGKIRLSLSNDSENEEEGYSCNIDNPNDTFILANEKYLIYSSSITMTMTEENSSGGRIFRFSHPKIMGMFVFEFSKEE